MGEGEVPSKSVQPEAFLGLSACLGGSVVCPGKAAPSLARTASSKRVLIDFELGVDLGHDASIQGSGMRSEIGNLQQEDLSLGI